MVSSGLDLISTLVVLFVMAWMSGTYLGIIVYDVLDLRYLRL